MKSAFYHHETIENEMSEVTGNNFIFQQFFVDYFCVEMVLHEKTAIRELHLAASSCDKF